MNCLLCFALLWLIRTEYMSVDYYILEGKGGKKKKILILVSTARS